VKLGQGSVRFEMLDVVLMSHRNEYLTLIMCVPLRQGARSLAAGLS